MSNSILNEAINGTLQNLIEHAVYMAEQARSNASAQPWTRPHEKYQWLGVAQGYVQMAETMKALVK